MYTQCPECDVAFRVTAEVLKQAAGKVRCGGCGVAFNALKHLSEEKPEAPLSAAAPGNDELLPELMPEEPAELKADTPPQSISAEQSAALLKTLDQLAGSDIRIEDTGVEWRVLDEDYTDTSNDEPEAVEEPIGDTGSLRFVIEDDVDLIADLDDEPSPIVDEMRFDDNTPLPDDFDFQIEPAPEPTLASPPPEPEDEPMAMQTQVDLALGDPDEWEDLLGDLDEPADEDPGQGIEVVESEEDSQDDLVMLADAGVEISIDEPLDMDTQFALQAEAMGIDLSGMHKKLAEDESEAEPPVDTEIEGDEPETSIEDDLLAAAFEAEAAVQAVEEASSIEETQEADEDDEPNLDEADGDELDDGDEPELDETEVDELEVDELDDDDESELDETDGDELDEDEDEDIEIDLDLAADDDEEPDDDIEDIALPFDDEVENIIETIAASLDDEPDNEPVVEPLEQTENDIEVATDSEGDEHVIPEMTEEEKTINMLIDQELFNIAFEDDDGFTSTIVQKQPDKKVASELGDNRLQTKQKDKPAPLFETIIMEGESVRGDRDKERLAADRAARSVSYGGPGVSIPFKKDSVEPDGHGDYDPPGVGFYVGIGALLLLLGLQVLHQSREALATVPAFNNIVGPVYRLVGQPLTPTWDISGWRFEATKGSTETAGSIGDSGDTADLAASVETSELLTIYSRIGNKSEDALPYPLVHLSLTDRFAEIIGSIVLEPSEYLTENADPRELVPPGNTFNAVISIESPSAEATGFKLNVCYRLASGQLRCAIEDFK